MLFWVILVLKLIIERNIIESKVGLLVIENTVSQRRKVYDAQDTYFPSAL